MWWHTRRYKISSFGERDESIWICGVGPFSRLLAAEVWTSTVVMLGTLCSEVVWRVLATHSIRQFPLHFSSRASPCAITFQLGCTRHWKDYVYANSNTSGKQQCAIELPEICWLQRLDMVPSQTYFSCFMGLILIKRITHLSVCSKHSQRKGVRKEIKAQKGESNREIHGGDKFCLSGFTGVRKRVTNLAALCNRTGHRNWGKTNGTLCAVCSDGVTWSFRIP